MVLFYGSFSPLPRSSPDRRLPKKYRIALPTLLCSSSSPRMAHLLAFVLLLTPFLSLRPRCFYSFLFNGIYFLAVLNVMVPIASITLDLTLNSAGSWSRPSRNGPAYQCVEHHYSADPTHGVRGLGCDYHLIGYNTPSTHHLPLITGNPPPWLLVCSRATYIARVIFTRLYPAQGRAHRGPSYNSHLALL